MAANRERGEVELAPGYVLRYTTNALVKLEDALGRSITQMGDGMREARALVWAGLLHAHPDLTLEQAGEIMDQVGVVEAVAKAGQALRLAFPHITGGLGKGAAESASTGESSA